MKLTVRSKTLILHLKIKTALKYYNTLLTIYSTLSRSIVIRIAISDIKICNIIRECNTLFVVFYI